MCHFSLARSWCTVPRVIKAMAAVFLVAALHQSTRFVDRDFLTVRFIWNEQVIEGCEYLTASWVSRSFAFLFCFRLKLESRCWSALVVTILAAAEVGGKQ